MRVFNYTPLCCLFIYLGKMMSQSFKNVWNTNVLLFSRNKQANNNTKCVHVCACTSTDTHLSIKAIKGNEQLLHSAPFCSTTSCRHAGGHTFPFIVAHKGYVCCWIIEERGRRVSFVSLQALANVIPWQCWQFYLLCSGCFYLFVYSQ